MGLFFAVTGPPAFRADCHCGGGYPHVHDSVVHGLRDRHAYTVTELVNKTRTRMPPLRIQ